MTLFANKPAGKMTPQKFSPEVSNTGLAAPQVSAVLCKFAHKPDPQSIVKL